jgi:hypothetical protein
MLEFNKLRVDRGDRSGAIEYRIEREHVESRAVGKDTVEESWRRIPPEKLRSHVMADTVLARWLRRRMGIHKLIRACQQDSSPFASREASNQADRTAA